MEDRCERQERIADYFERRREDDLHGLLDELEAEYFEVFGEEVTCIGFAMIEEDCDAIFEVLLKNELIEKMPDDVVF